LAIKTTEAKTCVLGFSVRLVYQITVHPSDEAILHSLKAFFKGAGDIIYNEHYVAYKVSKFSDIIQIIIPHFDNYPLKSTKAVSYYLFKEVVNLMVKREHITLPGFRKVLAYKASAKKGLQAKIFSSDLFKDITPHNVENVYVPDSQSILEPEYVSGFVAADGTFWISKPSEKTKWPNYDATFAIAQNQLDESLLCRIIKTLGCGGITKDSHGMRQVSVRNKEELQKIIVPFFTKYDINTEKRRDFLNFASAVSMLYKNKGKGLKNLTQEQRKHLDFCISQMNKNRYSKVLPNS
jgi:hypothetical protein